MLRSTQKQTLQTSCSENLPGRGRTRYGVWHMACTRMVTAYSEQHTIPDDFHDHNTELSYLTRMERRPPRRLEARSTRRTARLLAAVRRGVCSARILPASRLWDRPPEPLWIRCRLWKCACAWPESSNATMWVWVRLVTMSGTMPKMLDAE